MTVREIGPSRESLAKLFPVSLIPSVCKLFGLEVGHGLRSTVRSPDRLEVGGLCEERPARGGWGWLGVARGGWKSRE